MNIYMPCPVRGCPLEQWVSPDDPDASLGELYRHFSWKHPDNDPETLMAQVNEVER